MPNTEAKYKQTLDNSLNKAKSSLQRIRELNGGDQHFGLSVVMGAVKFDVNAVSTSINKSITETRKAFLHPLTDAGFTEEQIKNPDNELPDTVPAETKAAFTKIVEAVEVRQKDMTDGSNKLLEDIQKQIETINKQAALPYTTDAKGNTVLAGYSPQRKITELVKLSQTSHETIQKLRQTQIDKITTDFEHNADLKTLVPDQTKRDNLKKEQTDAVNQMYDQWLETLRTQIESSVTTELGNIDRYEQSVIAAKLDPSVLNNNESGFIGDIFDEVKLKNSLAHTDPVSGWIIYRDKEGSTSCRLPRLAALYELPLFKYLVKDSVESTARTKLLLDKANGTDPVKIIATFGEGNEMWRAENMESFMWREAIKLGLNTTGYLPTQDDLKWYQKWEKEQKNNQIDKNDLAGQVEAINQQISAVNTAQKNQSLASEKVEGFDNFIDLADLKKELNSDQILLQQIELLTKLVTQLDQQIKSLAQEDKAIPEKLQEEHSKAIKGLENYEKLSAKRADYYGNKFITTVETQAIAREQKLNNPDEHKPTLKSELATCNTLTEGGKTLAEQYKAIDSTIRTLISDSHLANQQKAAHVAAGRP